MSLEAAAAVVVGAFGVLLWRWWLSGPDSCGAQLPPELRRARLVYAERLFRSVGAVSITAKVDHVCRNAAGAMVLVELKTRTSNRVYQSDVIELSAQRVALMGQIGEVVADHGYVLTVRPDGFRMEWHWVKLMTHADVIGSATRWRELLVGNVEPQSTRSPGMCRKCAFVHRCNPPSR